MFGLLGAPCADRGVRQGTIAQRMSVSSVLVEGGGAKCAARGVATPSPLRRSDLRRDSAPAGVRSCPLSSSGGFFGFSVVGPAGPLPALGRRARLAGVSQFAAGRVYA